MSAGEAGIRRAMDELEAVAGDLQADPVWRSAAAKALRELEAAMQDAERTEANG